MVVPLPSLPPSGPDTRGLAAVFRAVSVRLVGATTVVFKLRQGLGQAYGAKLLQAALYPGPWSVAVVSVCA